MSEEFPSSDSWQEEGGGGVFSKRVSMDNHFVLSQCVTICPSSDVVV
jgi:hypothetical protein